MKKFKIVGLFAIVSTASLFLFNSCDKLLSINVNKEYANINYTIPAQATAGVITIDEEVMSDLDALAKSQGFDIDKIESATIKSATIKINDTNSSPVTTAIITGVKASMSADNVAVAEIATDDNVHTSADQIDLDLNGVDIAPYMKSSKFHFIAEITTNAPVPHPVPINISLNCTFKVKPLKK